MSQAARCMQCGGTNFELECGFYYCNVCMTQSQDVAEHIVDTFSGGASLGVTSKVAQKVIAAAQSSSKRQVDLTSWEVLNYVLKGFVDELLKLGAPPKLKNVALQLWVCYLRKLRIAFTSTRIQKKPRLGETFRDRDAMIIYGSVPPLPTRAVSLSCRKKRKKSNVSSNRSKRRSLAKSIYDESASESSISTAATSLDTLESSESHMNKFKFSKEVKEKLNSSQMYPSQKEDVKREKFSVKTSGRHPNVSVILGIIRLALFLCGSDIHLFDLERWHVEGRFSYENMKRFLPVDATLSRQTMKIVGRYHFTHDCIMKAAKKVAKLLKIDDKVLLPDHTYFSRLVARLTAQMSLPSEVVDISDMLMGWAPSKTWGINYEARAAAIILFALKIGIGLDDSTEYEVTKEGAPEGSLSWREWCELVEKTNADKSLSHNLTQLRNYRNSYVGPPQSLLSNWDENLQLGGQHLKKTIPALEEATKMLRHLSKPFKKSTLHPNGLRPFYFPKISLELPQLGTFIKKEKSDYPPEEVAVYRHSLLRRRDCVKMSLGPSESSRDLYEEILKTRPGYTWIIHSPLIRSYAAQFSRADFFCMAPEVLPINFYWMLKMVSQACFESPARVYFELVKVEKCLLTVPRHKKFLRGW